MLFGGAHAEVWIREGEEPTQGAPAAANSARVAHCVPVSVEPMSVATPAVVTRVALHRDTHPHDACAH